MTTATTLTIDEMVTQLQTKLAALGDGRDAKSDNERATYRRAYDTIQGSISGLMNAPDDLARAERQLAVVVDRQHETGAKQAELQQAIIDAPSWDEHPDARERDRQFDHLQQLRAQLLLLHNGQLLAAPGVTFLAPAEAERRVSELTERRDRAQRALDGYRQQAEALLAEVVVS